MKIIPLLIAYTFLFMFLYHETCAEVCVCVFQFLFRNFGHSESTVVWFGLVVNDGPLRIFSGAAIETPISTAAHPVA